MKTTKELTDVPGYVGHLVVIEKPNLGVKCDIQDEAMEVKMDPNSPGKKIGVGLSVGKMRLYTLAFCIKEAPFFEKNGRQVQDIQLRYNILRELDPRAGEYIYQEIDKLQQGVSEVVEKKLEQQPKDSLLQISEPSE